MTAYLNNKNNLGNCQQRENLACFVSKSFNLPIYLLSLFSYLSLSRSLSHPFSPPIPLFLTLPLPLSSSTFFFSVSHTHTHTLSFSFHLRCCPHLFLHLSHPLSFPLSSSVLCKLLFCFSEPFHLYLLSNFPFYFYRTYQSIHTSIYLSIYISIYLPTCLFIYLFICLSFYLPASPHPPIPHPYGHYCVGCRYSRCEVYPAN